MVQLANLVTVKEGVAPQSLNHFQRLRAVKITGTLAPGYTIDEALKAFDAAAKVTLAAQAQTGLDGQSREFRASGSEIYFVFVLALMFIYLVLAAQFESFVSPFVIMLSVPLSMTGALFALWLTGGHAEHLQPGRADHAGRPDHQARHPDRRVRQPAARAGRGDWSSRWSTRRRCGCGRS